MHVIRKGQIRWLQRVMSSGNANSFTPRSASLRKNNQPSKSTVHDHDSILQQIRAFRLCHELSRN